MTTQTTDQKFSVGSNANGLPVISLHMNGLTATTVLTITEAKMLVSLVTAILNTEK